RRPRFAEIFRHVEVRRVVIEPMRIDDDIRGSVMMRRCLDTANRGPFLEPFDVLGDVVPFLATVARDVHQAIVRACPEDVVFRGNKVVPGGLGDGEDGTVIFDAGVVAGDGTAGPFLFRLVVAGQVGADLVPARALV